MHNLRSAPTPFVGEKLEAAEPEDWPNATSSKQHREATGRNDKSQGNHAHGQLVLPPQHVRTQHSNWIDTPC